MKNNEVNWANVLIAGVLMLFWTLVGLLVLNECSGQTGYYLVIDQNAPTRYVDVEKTMDTAFVNAIFETNCNLENFSIVEAMDSTCMFDAMNGNVWVYCELRRVVEKKNGKLRYKRLRRKELKNWNKWN